MQLIWQILLLAIAYASTGWLGLQYAYFGHSVTLLWPPIGIAVAAIVLFGPRMWPGIAIGSLVTNLASGAGLGLALPVVFGNTLGPLVAGRLLTRRLAFRPQLDRYQDVLIFVGVAVLGCCALTATVGSLSLAAAGAAEWSQWPRAWAIWLAGDATGVLVVAPALLTWGSPPAAQGREQRSPTELTALLLTLAASGTIMLWRGDQVRSLANLPLPTLVWAALRFGPRGAAAAALAISSLAVWGTAAGIGPFTEPVAHQGMISLWTYLSLTAGSALLLTALLAERNQAVRHQERLMRELDHRVKNTLATVLAVAEQNRASATDVGSYVDTFAARIRALAGTHQALARAEWHSIALAEIVGNVLAPFGFDDGTNGSASGDPVMLPPRTTDPLTMMLHELATNAAKHGAWSAAAGTVTVTWGWRPNAGLRLVWTEHGGPAPGASQPSGYGLRVIEHLANYELGGAVSLDFRASGLVCTVDLPNLTRA